MKLHIRHLGTSGQPLIILHGLLGSSDNWFTLGKQLAEKHQVFLIDQRNHGLSDWSEEWSYEAMADDLYEAIETYQIARPVVIGHSMGGKTAMFFAGKHPELLERLVVVDIAPRYYTHHHQSILEGLNSLQLASLASRQEADTHLARYVEGADTRQFLLKNLYRTPENKFAWRMNLEVITRKIEEVGQPFPAGLQYEGKTIFIRGERSDYITAQDEANIKTFFPQASLVTIPQAGHWVQAEQPQKFMEALLAFLAE